VSLNLAMMLRESARAHPEKAALLYDGHAISYVELDAASDRFAAGLLARGLLPGEAVALQLPNVPSFVVACFGILKAGGVVVPMDMLRTAVDTAFVLRDSGARMLITSSDVADEAAKGAADAGVQELVVLGTPDSRHVPLGRPFGQLLETFVVGPPPLHQSDPGDPAAIVYTAGTTGRPKGAELSHFQLFMSADTPGRLFGVRDDDVVLALVPLSSVFGLSGVLGVCVRFAATMTLLPRFDPAQVLETIQRDRVSVVVGLPTRYVSLLHHPDLERYDLSTLRTGVCGGAPIAPRVVDDVERMFGIEVLEGYGLVETASTTTFNASRRERRIGSVGKPFYGVEVEIWDARDRVAPAGPQHVGEVVVRGVNVMRGYHGDPAATAEVMAGGWLHTGDLGYLDEDGNLFVLGRKQDVILRGGRTVYPREVEDALAGHPAVAEAAVIGVPHERLGEEIRGVVVLCPGRRADEAELIAHVRERVASYKVPAAIVFHERLPVDAAGRVLKHLLRAEPTAFAAARPADVRAHP
jgi:long-chain acyl-CoA synthetase